MAFLFMYGFVYTKKAAHVGCFFAYSKIISFYYTIKFFIPVMQFKIKLIRLV